MVGDGRSRIFVNDKKNNLAKSPASFEASNKVDSLGQDQKTNI